MTDPMPLPDVFGLIPAGVRQRITPDDIVAAEDPHRLGESPVEAATRVEAARAARQRMWHDRVPARFRDADLSALRPEQDPGHRVSGWWASGGSTLILRSDEPGVGKSYAAYAVGGHAVSVVGGAAWVMAWAMVDLNDAFRPGHDPTAYTVAQECDLLVLDDVGREQISPWTLERFQGVIDARWRERKRTVVTTNLSGEAFLLRYGAPIVDRLTDGMTYIEVTGVSQRKAAPW